MAKYRYVGGAEAEIWDSGFKFTKFGQLVEMPDDMAAIAKAGKISIIPAEEFDKLGFTPEDLKKFTRFESHRSAPIDFIEKRNQAWQVVHSLRAAQADPPSANPVVSSLETGENK